MEERREHRELELLSAYIDGELEEHDRARLETHAGTCSVCRETLGALRSTVADLATLPEPDLSPQESWALRGAISRARRPASRWQRFVWASGAAAAAAVAIVAIVTGGGGSGQLATSPEALTKHASSGAGSSIVLADARNFDAASAQRELLAVAHIVPPERSAASVASPGAVPGGNGAAGAPNPPTLDSSTEFQGYSAQASAPPDLDKCVRVVRSSTQELLEPVRYYIARYENKDAFLLFFHTADRFELWVTSRNSCEILFFSQAKNP